MVVVVVVVVGGVGGVGRVGGVGFPCCGVHFGERKCGRRGRVRLVKPFVLAGGRRRRPEHHRRRRPVRTPVTVSVFFDSLRNACAVATHLDTTTPAHSPHSASQTADAASGSQTRSCPGSRHVLRPPCCRNRASRGPSTLRAARRAPRLGLAARARLVARVRGVV